ncbi:Peptidoglycan O-acetyltransferase [Collinsella sp. AK_207A]|uniref:D-alanyl-lipoteichoic acid biosynthesis protein DltB n=1 Tax=Collinsella sp. AK_207A TaxID=2650472 RepID=UPI0012613A85|nr:D-alanyl-lipoteichoic acid biosynthesis protein DltB [Collinsella sp. AK_207A]VWM02142.1 Peptidoglycan O-acetyltransferase [Collinsella sp. AK_207A]
MGFYTSASFFIALAIVAVPAVALGASGRRIKPWGMVASVAMLAFLFADSRRALVAFLLFVALATASAYAMLSSWKSGRRSMAVYRISLAATLVPLVVYKVSAAVDAPGFLGFIGISYLTFRAVQVVVEIRDGLIEDLPLADYLYFLTFFATITSGPIDRSRRFLEDANTALAPAAYRDLATRGVLMLLAGAVMQLALATMVHGFTDPWAVNGALAMPNILALGLPWGVGSLVRAYGYAVYLYLDFAGYSLMAAGACYLFGIQCPTNFNAPWRALDLKDFWNRWHITLSTWLRDFVFMRFVRGLTRRHVFKKRLTTACCGYVVNMFLMGMWHGLTPDYLLYGLYHGVLLAATEAYQKRCPFYKRNKGKRWYKVLSWFVTMNLVIIGFSLFSGQAGEAVRRMIYG